MSFPYFRFCIYCFQIFFQNYYFFKKGKIFSTCQRELAKSGQGGEGYLDNLILHQSIRSPPPKKKAGCETFPAPKLEPSLGL